MDMTAAPVATDAWYYFMYSTPATILATVIIIRDVPDIRFRFRLAGYPAIFDYPVPVPVPAKILAVAGYCSRIIYLFNRAKKRYFRK